MQKEFQIQVDPEVAQNEGQLKQFIANKNNLQVKEIRHVEILKRSIDARQKIIKINLKINAYIQEILLKKKLTFLITTM